MTRPRRHATAWATDVLAIFDDSLMIPFRFEFDINAAIEQAFARLIDQPWGRPLASWQPAVDVLETTDAYTILIEVPGVPPEAVEVRMVGSNLCISGERRSVSITRDGRAVRLERMTGCFSRTINLSHPVDTRHIDIHAEYGVLQVRVPKVRPNGPLGIEPARALPASEVPAEE